MPLHSHFPIRVVIAARIAYGGSSPAPPSACGDGGGTWRCWGGRRVIGLVGASCRVTNWYPNSTPPSAASTPSPPASAVQPSAPPSLSSGCPSGVQGRVSVMGGVIFIIEDVAVAVADPA